MVLLLLENPHNPWLPHVLHHLANQPLHIWFLTDAGYIPRDDLYALYLAACWNQGCFGDPQWHPIWQWHEGDHWQLLTWLQSQSPALEIYAPPHQATQSHTLWQLHFDPVTSDVLPQLPVPHTLAETNLKRVLETPIASLEPPLPLETLLSQWLATTTENSESAWAGPLGQALRYRWYCQSACSGLSDQMRQWLTTAIQHHLSAPTHMGSRLVLRFFGRCPLGGLSTHKIDRYFPPGMLKLLPPPLSFELTIVVTTHNRLPWLKRTINSILSQTYTQWNLLIGDDASTDGTAVYLETLVHQDHRIAYCRHTHPQGFQANLTALYERARTELVVHCTDDDWWEPEHLGHLMAFFKAHPWVGLVTSACYLAEMNTGLVQGHLAWPLSEPGILEPVKVLPQLPLQAIAGPGSLYRKTVLKELAATDPQAQRDAQPPWPYAIWDSYIVAACLAYYEVGYIPYPNVYLALSSQSRTEEHLAQTILEEIEWFQQWQQFYARHCVQPVPLHRLKHWSQKLLKRLGQLNEQQLFQPQPIDTWLHQQMAIWQAIANVQRLN